MSSELKLSLENFQSISKGELIFHKGLNFIIGQSNSGKSATFRALKACLSNPAGSKRFIKKGTRRASVKLEYNGNQIIWNRTSGESSYTINGEDYIKTGKSSALKILGDEAGFAVDSNDIIMNIEEELQLPFPFGISNSDLFKLYEEVFCVSDSATILKQAKIQEDSVKEQITQLELDMEKCNLKLNELTKFEKEVDIERLKGFSAQLKKKREERKRLEEGLPIIKKAVLADSIDCPSLKSFENKYIQYNDKLAIQNTFKKLRNVCSLSKKISVLDEDNFTGELINRYQEFKELISTCKVLESLNNLNVSTLSFTSKLLELGELKELRNLRDKCLNLSISLRIVDFNNLMEEYSNLKTYKKGVEEIVKRGKELQQELKAKQVVIKEIEDKLSSYKVCPLCHRPLEGDEEC